MNTYLLNLMGKWMSFALISAISLFNINYKAIDTVVINDSSIKNKPFSSEVIKYTTDYIYNASLPEGTTNVVTEGINGLSYLNGNDTTIITEPVNEVLEIGTGRAGEYTGMLTGYGPDCYGCSALGTVSCRTREKKSYSLVNEGIYYDDLNFGKVRILAADHREFPCGTIIEVTNSSFNKELGIVLDTGSGMRNAYDNGYILIDMAFEKESLALSITNKNTSFTVKRWGW